MPEAALAPYACDPRDTRGRRVPEPLPRERTEFQRDRDRIIHSTAFRRLQYKTQVFVYHEGDHYRTRLTHSLEVAQIARSISRTLGLNEDLAEALALAHDLGHTCFGHAGEEALDAEMRPYGGFDHNDQTFRLLTRLERRYAAFDGLNLTWETLEGTVKHNGPLIGGGHGRAVPPTIAAYDSEIRLDLDTFASAEAQVAALADDIAYNNHDIDDGLRAGLFDFGDLAPLDLVAPALRAIETTCPGADAERRRHELVRRLIGDMVGDLLIETKRRLHEARPTSAAGVRALGRPIAAFSAAMQAMDKELKTFLFQRMYRHQRVTRMTATAKQVVSELFRRFVDDPERLPTEWRTQTHGRGRGDVARIVADYIAGMTDRFAFDEHARIVNG